MTPPVKALRDRARRADPGPSVGLPSVGLAGPYPYLTRCEGAAGNAITYGGRQMVRPVAPVHIVLSLGGDLPAGLMRRARTARDRGIGPTN